MVRISFHGKSIMYGSETMDLVVKYYDETFGITSAAEWKWYLEKVQEFGEPVLDVACGTGRLALRLSHEGIHVSAMDRSAGMLNIFRSKLEKEPLDIQKRIQLHNASMSEFHFSEKFKTIFCCDAFFHNLSVEDEISCLNCVRKHLHPDGRFLFNLPNPTCDYILKCSKSSGQVFEERGRYPLMDGSILLIEQSQVGDPAAQYITNNFRITRYNQVGDVLEKSSSSWKTRYLFQFEAIHLLYRCGFEVESLEGDYQHGSVKEGSQLIFQVRTQP